GAAAVVVLTAVLLVQCLLFADGGLLALGANVLNMAILAPLAGLLGLQLGKRLFAGHRGLLVGAAFGGWLGVVVAAAACAVELALSGAASLRVALPAMVGVHVVIGAGEGLITALVLAALLRARPDLVGGEGGTPAPARPRLWAGVALVGLTLCLAPFASSLPDGLEHVAGALGLVAGTAAPAPLPDYEAPFLGSAVAGTLFAGAAGALVVLLLSWWLARALVPARRER
ncbi:MAG: hypothetical protein FJ265_17740, partial [Planctomycetes bacterium]|nr:hypothetical protein [Planctomycetota bacterium]